MIATIFESAWEGLILLFLIATLVNIISPVRRRLIKSPLLGKSQLRISNVEDTAARSMLELF
jgi:hypothetical protein